jgi:hypothetical protein
MPRSGHLMGVVLVQFAAIVGMAIMMFVDSEGGPTAPFVCDTCQGRTSSVGGVRENLPEPPGGTRESGEPMASKPFDPAYPAGDYDANLGHTICGTVQDSSGRRITRGTVSAALSDGSKVSAALDRGTFAMSGLAPGAARLECRAPGFRSRALPLDLDPRAPIVRQNIVLDAARSLEVHFLTPDRRPLRDELRDRELTLSLFPVAVATTSPVGERLPGGGVRAPETFGVGVYHAKSATGSHQATTPKPADGRLEITVDGEVMVHAVMGDAVLQSRPVADGTATVEFILDPESLLAQSARLRLRVLDDDSGDPLPQATVYLGTRYRGDPHGRLVASDGAYLSDPMFPGTALMSVVASGFEEVRRFVAMRPGELSDLGVLRLRKSVGLKGRVVGATGSGVRAILTWTSIETLRESHLADISQRWPTEADGSFEITGLGPGDWMLSVRGPDDQIAHSRVSAPSGDLVLALKPGRRVRITAASSGERHLLAVIQDQSGHPVWAEPLAPADQFSLVLPDGHYSLLTYDGAAPVHSTEFEVQGRPLDLTIDL